MRVHSKLQEHLLIANKGGATSLSIPKPEDCPKEYERSIQLSSLLSLSWPEAELKQQQIIQEIKKEKGLAIKSKRDRKWERIN